MPVVSSLILVIPVQFRTSEESASRGTWEASTRKEWADEGYENRDKYREISEVVRQASDC